MNDLKNGIRMRKWNIKDEPAIQQVKKLKESLENLKDRIEDIKAIEVGINFNSSPTAFDVVLYSEFSDMEGLNAYQNHPEHLKIVDFVGEIRSERAVVDYED